LLSKFLHNVYYDIYPLYNIQHRMYEITNLFVRPGTTILGSSNDV